MSPKEGAESKKKKSFPSSRRISWWFAPSSAVTFVPLRGLMAVSHSSMDIEESRRFASSSTISRSSSEKKKSPSSSSKERPRWIDKKGMNQIYIALDHEVAKNHIQAVGIMVAFWGGALSAGPLRMLRAARGLRRTRNEVGAAVLVSPVLLPQKRCSPQLKLHHHVIPHPSNTIP